MKIINFLAASAALLSSLAVAAPIDAKREDPYTGTTVTLLEKRDDTVADEKRGEYIYPKATNSITGTGEDKREELYGPSEDLYSALTLKIIDKKDNTDSEEKREELYGPSEDLYSVGVLRKIEKKDDAGAEEKREELHGPSEDLYPVALLRGAEEKREELYTNPKYLLEDQPDVS